MEVRPTSSFCTHLPASFKESITYAFIIKAEDLSRVLDCLFFLGVGLYSLFLYLPTYLTTYVFTYFSVLLQRSLSYVFLNTSPHSL